MVRVGDLFTSRKSGYTGIVAEIVGNPNGSYRIRFDSGRWTTVS